MIVTVRTPLRVSLFGGGTDYPGYFRRQPGAVLGFTIDKYIYLSALRLSAFLDYRYRLSYSRLENVDSVGAIQHPVVRALLQHYGFDEPTDFSVQGDLPAASGLGSSSAFTVSTINLLSHMMGTPRTRMELAREAIFTEQVLLGENVGVQDQLHASFGGFNRFDLSGDNFRITPINISGRDLRRLAEWMVLVYTGVKRHASAVVADQVKSTSEGTLDAELRDMLDFVDAGQRILEDPARHDDTPAQIGKLLHESWQIKKRLSSRVSVPEIDQLYELCLANGAIGGKLCGAGSGGFLLIVVPPSRRQGLEEAVGIRQCVRFAIDPQGTVLISAPAGNSMPG